MTSTKKLPHIYIGEKVTIDGQELTVGRAIGLDKVGPGLAGVVLTVFSDDVHIDPTALPAGTELVTPDDVYPASRVADVIGYLKGVRNDELLSMSDEGVEHSDVAATTVIDVVDEALNLLGFPVTETVIARAWGVTNPPVRVTTALSNELVDGFDTLDCADEVIMRVDGMAFMTDGTEVGWVDASTIDNLRITSVTDVIRVYPCDDPYHLGYPLEETKGTTTHRVTWDGVHGKFTVPDRAVTVDTVTLADGVTYDGESRAEYPIYHCHYSAFTDIDSLRTTANPALQRFISSAEHVLGRQFTDEEVAKVTDVYNKYGPFDTTYVAKEQRDGSCVVDELSDLVDEFRRDM